MNSSVIKPDRTNSHTSPDIKLFTQHYLQMTIREILNKTDHRPWALPEKKWTYYQEWNNALFLHWQVNIDKLRKYVPRDFDIDLFRGKPWTSLVAFSMEKIRPKYLPVFPPVSNFHEINIRTYVTYNGKAGVYFLSIEGGKRISCLIAKSLAELPYRYSSIQRSENFYHSLNQDLNNELMLDFSIKQPLRKKTLLDKWLTERYALFQDTKKSINEYEIHHLEWPLSGLELNRIHINYSGFQYLMSNHPDKAHYSKGVKVIAWGKKKERKIDV